MLRFGIPELRSQRGERGIMFPRRLGRHAHRLVLCLVHRRGDILGRLGLQFCREYRERGLRIASHCLDPRGRLCLQRRDLGSVRRIRFPAHRANSSGEVLFELRASCFRVRELSSRGGQFPRMPAR